MSSNRLNSDTCQYRQVLTESTGPGQYQINRPNVSCEPCYPANPAVRLQHSGASIDNSKYMIDVDSEMMNITRPATKCSSKKWNPDCKDCPDSSGYPCGGGVNGTQGGGRCPDGFQKGPLTHFKDCEVAPREDTRLSNPANNLRGTGWNRWEWLCLNPQERVLMPFDHAISNRIVVKDNHRPCVPTPMDETPAHPKGGNLPCETINGVCANPTQPASVQWRDCHDLKQS